MKDERIKLIDDSSDHKYFTIVPNFILNHSSAIDKAIYLEMKRAAGDNGLCFMTEETMCKRNGIGKDTLHKSIKYLIIHKWVEFVGMTPSKTRPIKTYKILNIWKQNTDFYNDKKIVPETAVSLNAIHKVKDTAVLDGMIPPEKGGIRRTNDKEELRTNGEANASGFKGMASLRDVLSRHGVLREKRKGGATYKWQDDAVRFWSKLKLSGSPTAGWFRIFKLNAVTASRACEWVSDSGGQDLEKLTYWAFNQFKKNGKIVYDKKQFATKF